MQGVKEFSLNPEAWNPLLETSRLTLEPLTTVHAQMLMTALSDPHIYRFIPQEPPTDLEWLRECYLKLETRSSDDGTEAWLNWAIKQELVCLGRVEASVQLEPRTASIAYLLSPDYWGQGFALETVRALLSHLEQQGIIEVKAWVDSRNVASMKLLERLGFVQNEFLPAADHFKGEVSDEWVYKLDVLEFSKSQASTLERPPFL
jgi:[ribosomal protein S5]-alanine N-acetyltransferase